MSERAWWWTYFVFFAAVILGLGLAVVEVMASTDVSLLVKVIVVFFLTSEGLGGWVKAVHALKHAIWGTCTPEEDAHEHT